MSDQYKTVFGALCRTLAVFAAATIGLSAVNAQSFDDDPITLPPIGVEGNPIETPDLSIYSSIAEALGMETFEINALVTWLDSGAAMTQAERDEHCEESQSEFRTLCLDAMNNNMLLCGTTGIIAITGVAGATTGGTAAGLTAIAVGGICGKADYEANKACNLAADEFTYVGAPEFCSVD